MSLVDDAFLKALAARWFHERCRDARKLLSWVPSTDVRASLRPEPHDNVKFDCMVKAIVGVTTVLGVSSKALPARKVELVRAVNNALSARGAVRDIDVADVVMLETLGAMVEYGARGDAKKAKEWRAKHFVGSSLVVHPEE